MSESAYSSPRHRPLNYIAHDIWVDWKKLGKGVSPHALPYLDAMMDLESINDHYYEDSAASVVAYFLGNAHSWRGPVAKAIKVELNAMLKGAR